MGISFSDRESKGDNMTDERIHKIIYFDKETIRNILQERNKGEKTHTLDSATSFQRDSAIETAGEVELSTPLLVRLKFLFSSKMDIKYMVKKDETTTISSTEISEFEELKESLEEFKSIKLQDIENSATFYRTAGGYLRIVKGGVDGVDIKEFNNVMDSYNGYDTYRINATTYIRFNNSAFVSNYKRNDILTTTMTIYCIPVGRTEKERFDFIKEIGKMEMLSNAAQSAKTLHEMFPPSTTTQTLNTPNESPSTDRIKLYDAIYACTESGEEN